MGVKLSEFAKKLIWERKVVRKNMGPSIVPLMIIRFVNFKPRDIGDYSSALPGHPVFLLTACRRTGAVSANWDLTKLYSGISNGYLEYSGWWVLSEVVGIRPPRAISTNRLLEVYVEVKEDYNDEARIHAW